MALGYHAVIWRSETRHPHDETWRPSRAEVATDAASLGASLVGGGIGQAIAEVIGPRQARRGRLVDVSRLPTPLSAAVTIVAYDLVHSRLHHLLHVWGPGWRVHSVHHSPQRLYWFNASRFHMLEVLVDAMLEELLLKWLGLRREQLVAHQAVRLMYGQLQHANIDLRSGVLDHLFSTPDLHRWHHSTVYEEGDTNFGAITSVWDKVFGTWFRPHDRECPDALGIGRMPDFPTRFAELQRVPIDWAAIRERNAVTWNSPTTAGTTTAGASDQSRS